MPPCSLLTAQVPPEAVQSAEHVAAAVDATEQSLVLLQNSGGAAGAVLPFTAGGRVAVVGPHANDHNAILGNYLGQICGPFADFSSRACVTSV